jgi:ABC-type oligopeptide transport system substrate-binding subunit
VLTGCSKTSAGPDPAFTYRKRVPSASVAYSISLTETKKFYSALRGEKELVWADGTPFDYYDSQAQIDNAVANVTRFFRTHLSEELAA